MQQQCAQKHLLRLRRARIGEGIGVDLAQCRIVLPQSGGQLLIFLPFLALAGIFGDLLQNCLLRDAELRVQSAGIHILLHLFAVGKQHSCLLQIAHTPVGRRQIVFRADVHKLIFQGV